MRDEFDFEDNDSVKKLDEISKDIRMIERKNNYQQRRKLTDEVPPSSHKNFNFETKQKCSFVITLNNDPIYTFKK
jgi:hypothetical protein